MTNKKKMRLPVVAILTALMLVNAQCNDDEASAEEACKIGVGYSGESTLVSVEELWSETSSGLQIAVNFIEANFNLDFGDVEAENGITAYKITYNTTDPAGNAIVASGAMAVPDNISAGDKIPLIAMQKGTQFADSEIPSNSSSLLGGPFQGLFEASQGYFVFTQDYLGFGESNSIFRPYIVAEGYVNSTLDGIRAAREFAAEEGFNANCNLFIQGYSEGGYAAAVTHKAIDESEELSAEFGLTASAPGAGPYDVLGTGQVLVQQVLPSGTVPELTNPSYLPYVAFAYQEHQGFTGNMDEIFNYSNITPTNEAELKALYDVSTAEDVDDDLNETVSEFLTASFLSDFTGTGDSDIKTLFQQNSVVDGWDLVAPINLYHCTDDVTIPYEVNAQVLYDNLNGDSDSNVTITLMSNSMDFDSSPGSYHSTCPAIFEPINWFNTFLD